MLNFDRLLRPAFSAFSRPATLTPRTGEAIGLRVVDETDGAEVNVGQGVYSTVPAAMVRNADLGGADPVGGTLTFSGRSYLVRSVLRDLSGGEAGDLMLELQEL